MTANLCEVDGVICMAYDKSHAETPWHGTGQGHDGPMTIATARRLARLGFQVEAAETAARLLMADGTQRTIGASKLVRITYRTDTGALLGAIGPDRVVVQNDQSLEALQRLVGHVDAPCVDTAGVIGDGERVWVALRVPDSIREIAGDEVEGYALAHWAHDGNHCWTLDKVLRRTVCQNTLTANLREAASRKGGRSFVARHTSGLPDKLPMLSDLLEADTFWLNLREALTRLASKSVTEAEIKAFCEALFPTTAPAEAPGAKATPKAAAGVTRAVNAQARIRALFEGEGVGMDAPAAAGTRYGLYQAVTQFADREQQASGGTDRRVRSLFHEGTSGDLRDRAMQLLLAPSIGG